MSREAPLWGTWLRDLYIKLMKSCKGKKKKCSPASRGFWPHNLYIGRGCNSERCVIICCHIPLRLIYSSFFLPQSGFMSGSRTLHSWDVPLKNVDWALLQDKWPNLADYALKRPNFNKQAKGELHIFPNWSSKIEQMPQTSWIPEVLNFLLRKKNTWSLFIIELIHSDI